MEIRYNRWIAGLILVVGGLYLITGVLLLLQGKFELTLIFSALAVALGVLYWQRPYFLIQDGAIVVPAPVGSAKREFPIQSPQDVKLDNGKLMVNDGGTWKRVPVYRWASHPADWNAMVKLVQSSTE